MLGNWLKDETTLFGFLKIIQALVLQLSAVFWTNQRNEGVSNTQSVNVRKKTANTCWLEWPVRVRLCASTETCHRGATNEWRLSSSSSFLRRTWQLFQGSSQPQRFVLVSTGMCHSFRCSWRAKDRSWLPIWSIFQQQPCPSCGPSETEHSCKIQKHLSCSISCVAEQFRLLFGASFQRNRIRCEFSLLEWKRQQLGEEPKKGRGGVWGHNTQKQCVIWECSWERWEGKTDLASSLEIAFSSRTVFASLGQEDGKLKPSLRFGFGFVNSL